MIALTRSRAYRLILVFAILLVYAKTIGFDFVSWDDGIHVYENPNLLQLSWSHWLEFWTQPFKGLYIPVTYTAWSMIAWLSPRGAEWAPPFHFCNVLFHILNSLLVFEVFRILLSLQPTETERKNSELPALLGAMIFALHPLQVESVAWVTGFKEVLFGFFSLAALWAFLKGRGGSIRLQWGAFVLSIIAALCKPGGVVLPLLFAWISFEFFKTKARELARVFVPWTTAMIPIGIVAVLAQPVAGENPSPSLLQRLTVAGDALAFYLSKVLFPYPLLPQYDHSISAVLSENSSMLLGLATILVISAILFDRREKKISAGIGIFAILLLPVLGLIPFWYQNLSTVADHYAYLPMLGISLLVALVLRGNRKKIILGVVITFVGVFVILSGWQALAWQDGKTLALYTLHYNPKSPPAHLDLGLAYRDENKMDEAIEEFKAAIQLQEGYGDAYVDLGCALAVEGKYPDAINAFERALEISPQSAANQFNLAKALTFAGREREAASHFEEAIRLSPEIEPEVRRFFERIRQTR